MTNDLTMVLKTKSDNVHCKRCSNGQQLSATDRDRQHAPGNVNSSLLLTDIDSIHKQLSALGNECQHLSAIDSNWQHLATIYTT